MFFLLLCSVKKNQTTTAQQLYIVLLLSYSIFYCCYSVSYLYTIVGLLNTSNNIIYLFIFICFFLINKKKTTQSLLQNTVLFIFGFICLFIIEYQTLYSINVNINLINGILLLHPVILYLTYATIFITFVLFLLKFYIYIPKITPSRVEPITLLFLYSVSLFLGSSWAEQELLWGGWWSWDFVELLALVMLVYLLYLVHNKVNYNTNTIHIMFFFLFFLSTLSIRFNIINSIHNFIPTETQKQYILYIIYTILYVCLLLFLQKNLFFKEKTFYFFILCFIFYYVIYTSLLLWDVLHFTFSKIKPNQFFFMFFMFILCYVSTTYTVKIGFMFFFVWAFNSCFDFLTFSVLLLILLCGVFKKGVVVHITILYIFIHCVHNINIFKKNFLYVYTNNINNIKNNNLCSLYTNQYIFEKNTFKNQTFVTQNNLSCIDIPNKVFFDIFDKYIVIGKYTTECHSYDMQQLQQIHGFSIFTQILILLGYVIFLRLSVRKDTYLNI